MYPVNMGNHICANVLLRSNCNLYTQDCEERSVLYIIVSYRQLAYVKLLLDWED